MPRAGIDSERLTFDPKDDTVLLINADTPPTRKVAFERFRVANATVAVSVDAFEKVVDSLERFCVAALPVGILIPRAVVPKLFHATALRRRREARDGLDLGLASTALSSRRSW